VRTLTDSLALVHYIHHEIQSLPFEARP